MDFFEVLFSNPIINTCFVAWASAQLLKTFLYWVVTKRFRSERLIGSGGMPSSHTSTVCSLSIILARSEGFRSPLFAMSLIFAGIVMHDAVGVRRAAGEQAKVLNQMRFDFTDMRNFFLSMVNAEERDAQDQTSAELRKPGNATLSVSQFFDGEKLLKEFLGHTPIEVLAGAILGMFVGLWYPL